MADDGTDDAEQAGGHHDERLEVAAERDGEQRVDRGYCEREPGPQRLSGIPAFQLACPGRST